eukprot:TRINITY_DN22520_c0_g1_i1.p3 TRINITY_DN22520_c0_g1~~TRINITY_DN22520_c0_g1_i1.p3  ORF type:complete len:156 (-),score=38.23 TRINITY_DN22520_c0_g1_i1:149-616(-)
MKFREELKMSLYTKWTEMVVEYVKTKGENAFWEEYSKLEKAIYKDLLANHKEVKKTTVDNLAKEYNSTIEFAMGFIDGINDSLNNEYDLETLEADTEIALDINLETLYFNMLDAKAEYLYTLPQWDAIFSVEKREEIKKSYKDSKTVRNLSLIHI